VSKSAAILVSILLSGCCTLWPWSDCHDPQPACKAKDGGVDDASVTPILADASTDAPDAMPRPPDPSDASCVAEWKGGSCPGESDEPNNSMVMASYLKQCSGDGLQASAGPADVDVYRTGDCDVGTYVATGPLMPWAQLDSNDPNDASALRVCVFPTCATGATNVYACIETASGVDASDSAASVTADLWKNDVGFRGCCRTGPGRITVKADCPRRSPKIDTYLWIEVADHNDPVCHPYTLSYRTSQ
jgi:hypothetical protein